jgi:hypothetical protein
MRFSLVGQEHCDYLRVKIADLLLSITRRSGTVDWSKVIIQPAFTPTVSITTTLTPATTNSHSSNRYTQDPDSDPTLTLTPTPHRVREFHPTGLGIANTWESDRPAITC